MESEKAPSIQSMLVTVESKYNPSPPKSNVNEQPILQNEIKSDHNHTNFLNKIEISNNEKKSQNNQNLSTNQSSDKLSLSTTANLQPNYNLQQTKVPKMMKTVLEGFLYNYSIYPGNYNLVIKKALEARKCYNEV